MSGKDKFMASSPNKVIKNKRTTMVPTVSTSLRRIPGTVMKHKKGGSKMEVNKLSEIDITINEQNTPCADFESEYHRIAYGKFLRSMLEDCLLDEKIEVEGNQVDIQLAQLADRFRKTMDLLDKTNRRLKEISYVVEQKTLLDMKLQEYTQFREILNKAHTETLLNDLSVTTQNCLDKLKTKNVDFGYDKESGYKHLLDAVTEAIEGLEEIKKHSKLNVNESEYSKTQKNLDDLEKNKIELEHLKSDFEKRFPKFSENLVKEASEEIAVLMKNNVEDNGEEDDE